MNIRDICKAYNVDPDKKLESPITFKAPGMTNTATLKQIGRYKNGEIRISVKSKGSFISGLVVSDFSILESNKYDTMATVCIELKTRYILKIEHDADMIPVRLAKGDRFTIGLDLDNHLISCKPLTIIA